MIDIAGFGETHDGMDEDIRLTITRSAHRELTMCSVHWVARLERNDFAPGQFLEMGTQFRWSDCENTCRKGGKRKEKESLEMEIGGTEDVTRIGLKGTHSAARRSRSVWEPG